MKVNYLLGIIFISCLIYDNYYTNYHPVDIYRGDCDDLANIPKSFQNSLIQESKRQNTTNSDKKSKNAKRQEPKYIEVD